MSGSSPTAVDAGPGVPVHPERPHRTAPAGPEPRVVPDDVDDPGPPHRSEIRVMVAVFGLAE